MKTAEQQLERMEALVRRMAETDMLVARGFSFPHALDEARSIVSELPPPVDPVIIEARKIALHYALPAQFNCMTSLRVNQGEADDSDYIQAIATALRQSREQGREEGREKCDGCS